MLGVVVILFTLNTLLDLSSGQSLLGQGPHGHLVPAPASSALEQCHQPTPLRCHVPEVLPHFQIAVSLSAALSARRSQLCTSTASLRRRPTGNVLTTTLHKWWSSTHWPVSFSTPASCRLPKRCHLRSLPCWGAMTKPTNFTAKNGSRDSDSFSMDSVTQILDISVFLCENYLFYLTKPLAKSLTGFSEMSCLTIY